MIISVKIGLCVLQTVVCKKESAPYWAEIAVSMDGKALALVDKGGYLWGGSSDFKVGLLQYVDVFKVK